MAETPISLADELPSQESEEDVSRNLEEDTLSETPLAKDISVGDIATPDEPAGTDGPLPGHLWSNQIEVLPEMQQRVCVNFAVVNQYKEMLDLSDPPPVAVYQVGERFILVDGFHRLHASIGAGRELIPAIIKGGSWEDALIASCTANAYNGQAMSSADKRQAVTTMVETLEKLPTEDPRKKWSNREIARQTGASEATVRNIKAELETSAKISQFNEGDFIQVICPSGYQQLTYLRTGTLGTVGALDKKKGLFIVPYNRSLDWDGRMQPSAWVHPDLVIKSDALMSAKFAHDEKESEQNADGSDCNSAASHYTSVKQETTEQGKGLGLKTTGDATLPSIPPNPDTGDRTEQTPAAMTNGAAIRNGKPDVVATEIAIGIKHLNSEGLIYVMEAIAHHYGAKALGDLIIKSIYKDEVADLCNKCLASMDEKAFSYLEVEKIKFSGLSDSALKLLIEESKRSLNERHKPSYFSNEEPPEISLKTQGIV